MAKVSDTGDPTEYDDNDAAAIEAAVDEAWAEYESAAAAGEMPSNMRVSAQVEWSGVLDRARNGHRTTRLDGLELAQVKQALDRAREASKRAEQARPAVSYQAKGWHAQIRALTESKRGSAAADKAGLNPSARTLQRWLSEDSTPSKANQTKIEEAYRALRTWKVDKATGEVARANHELTDKLSRALRDRYGAEIRLRDITDLELQ